MLPKGVPDFAILHINMELLVNERFRDIYLLNAEVQEAFIKNGGKVYLFLDEVQEIPHNDHSKASPILQPANEHSIPSRSGPPHPPPAKTPPRRRGLLRNPAMVL